MADFLGMMKQAAQLKSKMEALQQELDHVEVEGVAGGGMVVVRMTAKMEVRAVKIDPALIKPGSARFSRTCWSRPTTTPAARRKARCRTR